MSKELIRPEQYSRLQTAILEDENSELSQVQLDELEALYEGTLDNFLTGKLVKGTVVRADSDGVLVDIGYKSDGLIPAYEFTEHELKKFTPGSEIEVMLDEVENLEGSVALSYEKAKALKAWDSIMRLFEEGKPVDGLITHKVKGGLSMDIGIPAFLPGSQIDTQRVVDFDQYVGQTITAHIIKVNKKRGNVIVSRRKFLNEQRADARKKVLDTLAEGQVIQGVVKNITNYGVFIDIGGVDGLLHITDMTWGRISHPSELVKIGETITVKVLSFDKDNEKISLGLKQLSNNPWQDISETLKVGSKIKGTISSITDYGLFVEIRKGVEGLVHISEISWTDRISNLAQQFKVGQVIDVLVVSLDKDNRRMSLSIKQMEKNPWESISEHYKPGDRVKGTISNITDFGIFVQIVPGVDGLVHISDLSWTEHIDHPSDRYKKGEEVEAVILAIDENNKKISLGIKQLGEDPWAKIKELYEVGSIVEGTVSKIINFGAFVRLQGGIEGLVHISELSDQNVEKVEDVLKIGQKTSFRVISVSPEERRIGLSLKLQPSAPRERNYDENREKKAYQGPQQQYQQQAPKREKPVVYKETAPAANKPKSLFQLELEKHQQKNQGDKPSDDTTQE